MSLHAAAKHLAAQGRRGDTHLVHMTSGEVRSLQDLAKAHGGSLTTNPHTGLPEASFLSAVMPMAAGFALNAAFPGLGAFEKTRNAPAEWVGLTDQNAPMDEAQKQVFALMPWVMMFIMAPFAVGLQIYWITNNCLTILQQRILYARPPQLKTAPAK